MTPEQIIADLKTKFSKHEETIGAWVDGYRAVIGRGGLAADDAYRKFVADWKPTTPPKPAQLGKYFVKGFAGQNSPQEDIEVVFGRSFEWIKIPAKPPYFSARLKVYVGDGHPPEGMSTMAQVIQDLGYDPRVENRCIGPWKEFEEKSKDWSFVTDAYVRVRRA